MSHPKVILERLGIRPKKGFGQNFLFQKDIAEKIVDAASLTKSSRVLEIGPGLGVLTDFLSEGASELIAVEKDKKLISYLEEKYGDQKNTKIISDDFLKFEWPEGRWTVLGNIPYNITSPLILNFVKNKKQLEKVVLMIPEEIAERLKASEGSLFGSLSLGVRLHFDIEKVMLVKPANFYPVPKITSEVLVLNPKKDLLTKEEEIRFHEIVRSAFKKRRKMLRGIFPSITYWNELGIDPQKRPQNVSFEEYLGWSKYKHL